jgi:hypothetical protein
MNLIIKEIGNLNEDKKIDILFGNFNDNIGNTNLLKEQFDFIKIFLQNKYKKNNTIINNKYYYNNLKMVIQENKHTYYNVNNILLDNSHKNMICMIKNTNIINEFEFPIIAKYHKLTKNFINIYNHKNIISFLLITENESINKFKIKINYSKNNFDEIKKELDNLWNNIKNKFTLYK